MIIKVENTTNNEQQ